MGGLNTGFAGGSSEYLSLKTILVRGDILLGIALLIQADRAVKLRRHRTFRLINE